MDEELEKAVASLSPEELDVLNSDPELLSQFKAKYGEKKEGLIRRAWNALAIPAEKSREGLQMIADAIPEPEPTGNLPLDLIKGAPSIMAKSNVETMSKVAPAFIDRASLLTAGAAKGLDAASKIPKVVQGAKGAFNTATKTMESFSGLEHRTPGILQEAAQDATLMFQPGRKAVGKMFEEALDVNKVRPALRNLDTNKELVRASEKLAKAGKLNPDEAIQARRALDDMKGTSDMPEQRFRDLRDLFDPIAKQISAAVDKAHVKAIKAEALRSPLRLNKTGGASGMQLAVNALTGPGMFGLTSPAAHGGLMSVLGLGARKGVAPVMADPQKGLAIGAALKAAERLMNSQEQKEAKRR